MEWTTVETADGAKLSVRLFKPAAPVEDAEDVAVFPVTGAPIAGSAVDKVDQVVGYVSIGYPFGLLASILFGRHHDAILKSEKPKLFIMGTKDGFTSVKQLQNKLKSAAGRVDTHLIEGAGHFQMEGPAFDAQMAGEGWPS
uniref:Alpha/beta hydrolase n=1 Tax=Aegilops tauschii TaxID=37682 RepID=R7WC72_AEGTA